MTGRLRRPHAFRVAAVAASFLLLAVAVAVAPSAHAQSGAPEAVSPPPDGPSAPALVAARDRTVLAAELTATIADLPARPGALFETGDVLTRFNCRIYEAQRAVARADVEAAEAERAVKRRLFELQSAGALEVEVADAAVRRAEAQLHLSQVQVDRCTLRAPYKGRVVEWRARPHAAVEIGDPLLEIVGVERLEVEIIAPAAWLGWLRPGVGFTLVGADGAHRARGALESLGAVVDPASQTVVVRGALNEAGPGWLPGVSGRAVFSPPGMSPEDPS